MSLGFPDFAFNTNNMITFTSVESLTRYARTMLQQPMFTDIQGFTSWENAFDKYFIQDIGNVVKYTQVNGQDVYEMPEIVVTDPRYTWVSNGETISVSSGTAASQNTAASAVGGGGAKSAPKVQTIVTDTTTGGATPGAEAKGLKNFGIPTQTEIANVMHGLSQTLGIANLALNLQNLNLYRQLLDYVFGIETPGDISLNDLKNLFFTTTDVIVARDEQDNIITTVPESIAIKMYDFFKEHITQTGGEGDIYVDLTDLDFSLVVWGDIEDAPSYSYARYLKCITNVAPRTGAYFAPYAKISDQMMQICMNDFCNAINGAGFSISNAVTASLVESMEGFWDLVASKPVITSLFGSLANVSLMDVTLNLNRGENPPPKSTPVSLSEISGTVYLYDTDLHIDTTLGEDDPRVECFFGVSGGSGVVAQAARAKYLKRGKTGEQTSDYGYYTQYRYADKRTGESMFNCVSFDFGYPSNVLTLANVTPHQNSSFPYNHSLHGIAINGYNWNDTQLSGSVIDNGMSMQYSNLGFSGYGVDYEFDETLSAGFVRRSWNVPTSQDVLPHDNTTIDGVFPTWTGSVKTLSQSDANGNERQTNYIPVAIPHGTANANVIVNQGGSAVQSPVNNSSQNVNQQGIFDPNANIDDVNKEINRTVDSFNTSRTTPESAPDPIPEGQPNPQYPNNPPVNPSGDSGDTPTPSTMPGMTASGMCSVYNPSKEQLKNFSAWLWSLDPLENLKKILSDPVDAIIGLHIMYATPVVTTASNIICGYLDSGVAAPVVSQQFIDVDCGYVDVPEYYGNATDYEPYVHVNCYLPFVGIVALKPNDVIGKRLYITYGVDVLTGTCLARLVTKKGNSEIQCYTFPGNCSTQVPLTGGNYAQVIRSIASMAVGVAGSVLTANPLPAIGGVIGGAMSASLDTSRSGSLGANAGALGIRKPYLIITRRAAYDANGYSSFYGYPANKSVILGTCKGYTRVKSVHIESMDRATDNEKMEIETLLKDGIIIN